MSESATIPRINSLVQKNALQNTERPGLNGETCFPNIFINGSLSRVVRRQAGEAAATGNRATLLLSGNWALGTHWPRALDSVRKSIYTRIFWQLQELFWYFTLGALTIL